MLGSLGSGEGLGNKQPDAIIFLLFLWVGLGCGCSSPLGKHPFAAAVCPAMMPLPARTRAIFPVLWLIGRPWPKGAAIHARPAFCRPLP